MQTRTRLDALRSASILWGATGVSVRKAISWKKMGKHAPRGREVRIVFILRHFLFTQGHIWLWCGADHTLLYGGRKKRWGLLGVMQTRTPGSHYTSQLLVHVRTVLSPKHTADPVTPVLLWFAGCIWGEHHIMIIIIIVFFLPQIQSPVKRSGAADLLLPPFSLSSITYHNISRGAGEWETMVHVVVLLLYVLLLCSIVRKIVSRHIHSAI